METIILFAPLAGALIAGLTWRAISEAGAQWVATGFAFFAAALSWVQWFSFDGALRQVYLLDWLRSGTLDTSIAMRLDALSVQMMLAVTSVSALCHLYALGFMDRDKSFDEGLSFRPRFFAYLSLFTFAMLILVVADGLLQVLLGLQLAAVMAYLLISFRTHFKSANAAAIKAFLFAVIGQGAMILGVAGIYLLTDSLQLDDVFDAMMDLTDQHGALMICAGLILLGAMAISAQILFHVWLPDAMEAPAPAAALLSGVFLAGGAFVIWRLDPVFAELRLLQDAMVWIGIATALVGGLVASNQHDIKRSMGFIAMAQMGIVFAILGLGLGNGIHRVVDVHIPLLIMLQAVLVLCAGAITRSMDDSRDMADFGGLRAKLPGVALAMMLAGVAATGFGFAGAALGVLVPGRGAMVAASAYLLHPGLFAALCVAGGLGVFAIWRVVYLCFAGSSRAPENVFDAVEAAPRVMGVALALFCLFLACVVLWQVTQLSGLPGLSGPDFLMWWPLAAALAGFALATWFYVLQPGLPKALGRALAGVHSLLAQGFYLDRTYGAVITSPLKTLGSFFGETIDARIDGPFHAIAARVTPRYSEIADRRFGAALLCCAAAVFFGLVAAITWSVLAGGAA